MQFRQGRLLNSVSHWFLCRLILHIHDTKQANSKFLLGFGSDLKYQVRGLRIQDPDLSIDCSVIASVRCLFGGDSQPDSDYLSRN